MQNKLEALLSSILSKRYGSQDVEDVDKEIFTNILNEDNAVKRNVKFLEHLSKRIDFSSYVDEGGDEPSGGTFTVTPGPFIPGAFKLPTETQKDLAEAFKNGRTASDSFGIEGTNEPLDSYSSIDVAPSMKSLYYKLVGNFTDSWTQFLRRDDGRFVGLKSGRFDHRNAYKSELSPNIFYKDVAVIRDSDLKVFMINDVSGSTFSDMEGRRRKIDYSQYDANELYDIFKNNKTEDNYVFDNHQRQQTSSCYNMVTISVAIGNVLKQGRCDLDFNLFSDVHNHISNTIYDANLLGKYFGAVGKHGGGGTNLKDSTAYLSKTLESTRNRDKLILILTDGAIVNINDVVKSFSGFAAEYNTRVLFVGLGVKFHQNLYKIPNYDGLTYDSGEDLVNRFPSDFASFLMNKFFLQE
jgi:hypothetical protein